MGIACSWGRCAKTMSKRAAITGWAGLGLAGILALGWALGAFDRASAPEQTTPPAAALDAPTAPPQAADAPPGTQAEPAMPPEAIVPPQTQADAAPADDALAPIDPPKFDLVRADGTGPVLVAGQAAPTGRIEVLVDGTAEAETEAGGDGKFVTFLDLDTSQRPRVLTLRLTLGDVVILSEEEIILAPAAAPVAQAETASPEGQGEQLALATPEPQVQSAPQAEPQAQAQPQTQPEPQPQPETLPQAEPPPQAVPQASDTEATAPAASQDGTRIATQTPPQADSSSPAAPSGALAGGAAPPAPAANGAAPRSAGPAPDPQLPKEPSGAPAVMLSTARGVELLRDAPLPAGEMALDAISYDEAGEVLLSGRGAGDGFVRVYLDNAPLTTAPIGETGRWRVTLPAVDSGTYTLRVDQVDGAGTVTARVESPFRRESAETLAAAAQGLQGPVGSITVQPGNTLWAIARDRYGDGMDYVTVFEANRDRIRDPDLIYPGQIFDLPDR
jgi:nucleoid-associated protein YgaU